MNCRVLVAILAAAPVFLLGLSSADAATKPNIVFLLCDDLGYGDAKCNNPQGKIATPNIDKLAAQGIRLTDAHGSSSVCTPTRYSLLTGRYNWRSRLQSGVLGGLSPRLIEPGRLTVAELLKRHGYHTAAIGKWHLGLDWAPAHGKPAPERNEVEKSNQVWSVDFTKPIAGGPNSVGFEYFFGIAASLDMVPYTFMATCADILGTTLPDDAGEDSVSFLPALTGKPEKPLREALVHHSINGRFAVRQGQWKLELCPGSGGWSSPGDPQALKQGLPDLQLYDLIADLAEQKNLQAVHPEITERLTKLIERYVTQGRSTPGRPQKNDAQIDIWKKPKANSASKP